VGFNLDAGSTPGCTPDISWNGTQVGPAGTAMVYAVAGAGGSAEYDSLTLPILQSLSYQLVPVGVGVSSVFAVKTNTGDYAKVLVTAASSSSITLQYTTYGATAGAPVILKVVNNYSYSKIAPGTLFTILGCGLATPGITALLQDPGKGLPLTLNGTSISVTAGGVTTQPPLYYATATEIGAVLPSATPAGTANVTVTYNSQVSSTTAIGVWPTAFGFDSYDASGSGMAVATDLNYKLITPTYSAMPGQVITFWGSGLGADPQDSDTTFTANPHPVSVPQFPLQVLIGGIPATILYQGSSGYPGLNQINVRISQAVPPGCAVSVVAVNADYQVISNSVTLPISAPGGICTDPLLGITAAQQASLSGKDTVHVGILAVEQANGPFAEGAAVGDFFAMSGSLFNIWAANQNDYGTPPVSLGSCLGGASINDLWLPVASQTPLDAGALTFNGPGGSRPLPFQAGLAEYQLLLGFQDGLWNPLTGGTYSFTGTGGKDVGALSAGLKFVVQEGFPSLSSEAPIAISTTGLTINWTGGSASHYITIAGTSGPASFVCNAPASAGTFAIPPSVLVPLSGAGTVSVRIATYPQPVTIPGLDAAYIFGYVTPLSSVAVTYN
jgi:uncharacterized protein (TIGR03437 family)